MKQKFIYISKDGIPMAPTVDCSLLEAYNVDANELSKFSFAMGKKVEECKNTSVPVREEDREYIWGRVSFNNTQRVMANDTFYLIEPYEFEQCWCDDYVGVKIIRPSEPKADPKESLSKFVEGIGLVPMKVVEASRAWSSNSECQKAYMAGYMDARMFLPK